MPNLPEEASKAWDNRNGSAILATVDGDGRPNVIYVTCVAKFSEDTLVVADNYFDKTRRNILRGSPGAILFITKENKAYQVKGRLEYHTSGPIYEDMKKWNPSKHPGHAAAALRVEEVFSGAKRLA
jgi:predicted pyridoxine 5'-phosphate oxidase superfamily flavin-nucleotide-binding protein